MEDYKKLIGKNVIFEDKKYKVVDVVKDKFDTPQLILEDLNGLSVIYPEKDKFSETCLIGDIETYDYWLHMSIS